MTTTSNYTPTQPSKSTVFNHESASSRNLDENLLDNQFGYLDLLSYTQSFQNLNLSRELMRIRFRLSNIQLSFEDRSRIFVVCVIFLFTLTTFIRITFFFLSSTDYTSAAFNCLEKRTSSWKEISTDDFVYKLRNDFPRLVNQCSDKQLGARVQYLSTGVDQVLFAFPLVWASDHVCDVLFIKEDPELISEQLFKDKYPYCSVYSASPGLGSPRGTNIIQHPIYITHYQRTNKRIRTRTHVDILTYIQTYIRRFKLDSLVLGNRDNSLRLLGDITAQWGPIGENNIAICQLNVAIKIPESNIEKQIFKDLLMNIIKEKRYLITEFSVDAATDQLKIFFMYANSSFCWAKYITSRLDYSERS